MNRRTWLKSLVASVAVATCPRFIPDLLPKVHEWGGYITRCAPYIPLYGHIDPQ